MKKILRLLILLLLASPAFAVDKGFNTYTNGLTPIVVAGTEGFPCVQAGVTSLCTPASLATYFNSLSATLSNKTAIIGIAAPANAIGFGQTAAEATAGVTPTEVVFNENYFRRYCVSTCGTGEDDTTAWNHVLAVCAVNNRPVHLEGLGLTFGASINYDYHACGVLGEGATLGFTGMTGTAVALTFNTTSSNFVASYDTGGLTNIELVGPGIGSTITAVKLGTLSTGGNTGAFAVISNFYITGFGTGITWGSNSWLQVIGDGYIQNCAQAILYPSGLTNSGENIQLGNITLGSNTNGVLDQGGTLNFAGFAGDYNTNNIIRMAGGTVRANHVHLEGNTDNDYWIDCGSTALTEIDLESGDIAWTGSTKTAFPIGNCSSASGSTQINFGDVTFFNFTETNYGFNYIVNGHGTIRNIGWQAGGTAAALPAAVPFSANNALVDGGFEQSSIVDWYDNSSSGQTAISTAQHFAGAQSMAMAPTSSGQGAATLLAAVSPGTNFQFAFRMIFAGTASTDQVAFIMAYLDQHGNTLASNTATRLITTLPTSWTRYVIEPFGQAPVGARYARIVVIKESAAAGNSDGNGTVYFDDCYFEGTGGLFRQLSTNETYPQSLTGKAAAFSTSTFNTLAIDGIWIKNTTANAITGGLKMGSTSGGTDYSTTIAVGANANIYVPGSALSKQFTSGTGRQNYFFDAVTGWNGASINMTIVTKRVMEQGY